MTQAWLLIRNIIIIHLNDLKSLDSPAPIFFFFVKMNKSFWCCFSLMVGIFFPHTIVDLWSFSLLKCNKRHIIFCFPIFSTLYVVLIKWCLWKLLALFLLVSHFIFKYRSESVERLIFLLHGRIDLIEAAGGCQRPESAFTSILYNMMIIRGQSIASG